MPEPHTAKGQAPARSHLGMQLALRAAASACPLLFVALTFDSTFFGPPTPDPPPLAALRASASPRETLAANCLETFIIGQGMDVATLVLRPHFFLRTCEEF